eukprot:CAMPEP_0183297348 /NCGR_PEP_ID=MMETSP0160_2-20130417/4671_1 /TAXON_ID=2839 ORGANISM="Odontella Sinensis, Strain Grunow 1884" /NCGR_SAMPLE_ID=MMETSP0160_2 /ASSEMBLY_ACC=CAM_ASM_000250 /LENGTH=382 /DNA_ID=CAMNT_0025459155 /DNA_START=24 /DNA_END=1172 /DNA_ORIENTATION=-
MSTSKAPFPKAENEKKASVVIVGCGAPLRSMGWYHAAQLLDDDRKPCPSAVLKHVVEPWYMSDAGKLSPGSAEFDEWRADLEKSGGPGVGFHASVEDVPPPEEGENRMGIISARTADNPHLLSECVKIGCKTIYLEKPGAPTVAELEDMRDAAKAAEVTVLMGFNKNVSAYLGGTMELAARTPGSNVTFLHNNAYPNTEEALGECFERNAEGMLKNMAIHELAILVTYYDVTVNNIAEVIADKDFSTCRTLKGPSGKDFTDFDKLQFKIITKTGKEASVAADRCGGDDSVGIVTDASGNELGRFFMPDNDAIAATPMLEKKYPGAMPYFFAQDPDYAVLKEKVAQQCVGGKIPDGVATIDIAVETLKVAEYLTPILQKQLLD